MNKQQSFFKTILPLLSIIFFAGQFLLAQSHTDFIGAGHDNGVTVTTSHNQNASNNGQKTVDGFPITDLNVLSDASRFLAQASMGADWEMIQMTAAMGYEAWIDEQFTIQKTSMISQMYQAWDLFPYEPDPGEVLEENPPLWRYYFNAAWWNNVLSKPDALRQRIALALSEIFVISLYGSDLFEDVSNVGGNYLDLLSDHAFGNYRNLLGDVTRNPGMGIYLSHYNNPKIDLANNIFPDENYAREIMQLFSIGLKELNNDGSLKLDNFGNAIPTYTNLDINEYAKIFTGFGDGSPNGEFGAIENEDEIARLTTPMKMYENWHELGQKNLLNGLVVPAGQTGEQDVDMALDGLFAHDNVPPFISKKLIQFLVSSNPSPAYINRVSNVFIDNGQGVRGDFKAVVKAILLDSEARDCDAINHPTNGKLREPLLRLTSVAKAFNPYTSTNPFFAVGYDYTEVVNQTPLMSPSVFNFFSPFYQPAGDIQNNGLVGPEFQILNSSTSISYVNVADAMFFGDEYLATFEEGVPDPVLFDLTDEQSLLSANPNDATVLVERLNILMAAGQLSNNTKNIIINAVDQLTDADDKLDMAMYLIMISPDAVILK